MAFGGVSQTIQSQCVFSSRDLNVLFVKKHQLRSCSVNLLERTHVYKSNIAIQWSTYACSNVLMPLLSVELRLHACCTGQACSQKILNKNMHFMQHTFHFNSKQSSRSVTWCRIAKHRQEECILPQTPFLLVSYEYIFFESINLYKFLFILVLLKKHQ